MRAAVKRARPEWATKIGKLRAAMGLNQTDFAAKLNVSAMAVSRWERAINEPPADCYIRLGILAGNPDCWFFWQRAGLERADIKRVW